MTELQREQAASMDIGCWIALWQSKGGKCPNCGAVFDDMHPAQNIYPHWTAQCKRRQANEFPL